MQHLDIPDLSTSFRAFKHMMSTHRKNKSQLCTQSLLHTYHSHLTTNNRSYSHLHASQHRGPVGCPGAIVKLLTFDTCSAEARARSKGRVRIFGWPSGQWAEKLEGDKIPWGCGGEVRRVGQHIISFCSALLLPSSTLFSSSVCLCVGLCL
jgi:hypothetical protein